MVIVGLGGEGIIFVTRILVEGFYQSGHPVISTETHGMAMRGGSVISQVKIGNYQSPLIRYGEADILLGISVVEAQRNRLFLKEGGALIMNTKGQGDYCVDATSIAHRLGNPRGGNLVLLGYTLGNLAPAISLEPFLEVVKGLSPERFLSGNLGALQEGWRVALKADKGRKKGKGIRRHG
jgi:indolepyruvate ferredoxin oxidoreductase beta subunit